MSAIWNCEGMMGSAATAVSSPKQTLKQLITDIAVILPGLDLYRAFCYGIIWGPLLFVPLVITRWSSICVFYLLV